MHCYRAQQTVNSTEGIRTITAADQQSCVVTEHSRQSTALKVLELSLLMDSHALLQSTADSQQH